MPTGKNNKNTKVEKKHNISDEKLEEFKEAFDLVDTNEDGRINVDEITKVLKTFGQEKTKEEIKEMISDIDADNSGEIDFDEFVTFMIKVQSEDLTEEEEVIRAFETFDKDKNGYLTIDELRHILTTLGDKFTDEEVDEIFREADVNRDGKLEYKEFVKFWIDK
jgi:calmodulin